MPSKVAMLYTIATIYSTDSIENRMHLAENAFSRVGPDGNF
ncbi:MAG: hypothetical protein UW10_C0031G0007 [Candidatus Magasanikbacteria bacterium GW2011_GWA2_43_9]|nr:MAG: hypothetical protein UW10_C0031G0007 [Candidatus Magasanikbacteria bacterium GW2011_GWA2_43_9]